MAEPPVAGGAAPSAPSPSKLSSPSSETGPLSDENAPVTDNVSPTTKEEELFRSNNEKSKNTPQKGNTNLSKDTVNLISNEIEKNNTLRIENESYGKRKRVGSEESLTQLTWQTADDSMHSTEQSDRESSAKDESDFSVEDSSSALKGDSSKKASDDDDFPVTVTLLKTPNGAKVYLVGTAHFSEESQEDVSKVIRKVQPHIVMVELCSQRINILQLDEKIILEEAKNINLKKIRSIMQQNGLFNSLMYILLLNMSAHVTKQLGIAPGGEFRRALQEAKNISHCIIHLGDRPIQVTMHRALSALSWWQTFKLLWRLLTSNEKFSKEDVEQCKQGSLLRQMLADMENEFPALKKVFLEERDIFLTHSLQIAANTETPSGPVRVVGIVGIGHVQGILDNWGKVPSKAIPPIMKIPPASLSSRIMKVTFKCATIGLIVYAGFKIFPKKWLPYP